jgi:hypothetical protein
LGTETTNLDFYKPDDGEVGWGAEVRANFDTLDTRLNYADTGIRYVDALGNNNNDGLTPGTAMQQVTAAFDDLSEYGGNIRVISSRTANEITYWDPLGDERGLWMVGPNDDGYEGIPANGPDDNGFRRQKPVIIEGWGTREYSSDATGSPMPQTYIAGGSGSDPLKPALWFAGTTAPVTIRGIRCVNLANAVKIGLRMTDGAADANTSSIFFDGCMFTSNNNSSNADTVEAAVKMGHAFWVRFQRCTFGAADMFLTVTNIAVSSGTIYTYTTSVAHGLVEGDGVDIIEHTPTGYNSTYTVLSAPTSTTFTIDIGTNPAAVSVYGRARPLRTDRRACILVSSTTASSGLILVQDCVFNGSAGFRYRPTGNTTTGNLTLENIVMEGDFSNAPAPIFDYPSPSTSIPYYPSLGAGRIYLRNFETADTGGDVGDGYNQVLLEGIKDPDLVVAVNVQGIRGPHTSITSGLSHLKYGDIVGTLKGAGEARRWFGEHEGHRRSFHPAVARYANNVWQDETTWSGLTGSATVTTGQAAPDGTTRAGLLTSASGTDYRRVGGISTTVSVGDFVIAGGWYRCSVADDWPPSGFTPFRMVCDSSSVKFDTQQVYTNSVSWGTTHSAGRYVDGDWRFETVAHQVMETTSGTHAINLDIRAYADYPFYHYAPVLLYIPVADGLTYAEVRDMRDGLASFSNELSVGEVGTLLGQTFNAVGGAKIGDGGKITKVLTGSTTWDPAEIADGDDLATTLTVTGAAVGDPCFAGFTTLTTEDVLISANVSATNTVQVVLLNRNGAAVNLASGTLKVTVFQNA